ncbi:hypothetical protein U9M48_016770 [Paspalum notatum var. saurae]|uniref:Uncharacterized protein n=1 Tax=Paspalum notatum var. saurae TaxID=547442 RepID=A0AAQ3TA77_PASNO
MAHYQEVDYCSEEVRTVANPAGFGRNGGVQQHIVKEKFEEVDRVSRTGSHGSHHHHHGHRGHGSGHFEVRETRIEEDINTCTGEFHERKESFLVRAD